MIAVYPGTFDPFTNGHLEITKRALKIFDKIIILVAENKSKNTLLPTEVRKALIEKCFENEVRVQVKVFDGLLTDYLKSINQTVIVRGIRNVIDLEYEKALQSMYKHMHPEIEVILFQSSPETSFLSSTFIRDIVKNKGNIKELVPNSVHEYLEKQDIISDNLNKSK